jgi:hypothetical protein
MTYLIDQILALAKCTEFTRVLKSLRAYNLLAIYDVVDVIA